MTGGEFYSDIIISYAKTKKKLKPKSMCWLHAFYHGSEYDIMYPYRDL